MDTTTQVHSIYGHSTSLERGGGRWWGLTIRSLTTGVHVISRWWRVLLGLKTDTALMVVLSGGSATVIVMCVCMCDGMCVWVYTNTCSFNEKCPIAGASTVDGHHRDSVECVTDQSSEGVGVHWWSIISYDHRTTTVIDSDIVAGRNTTSSGRGPGHWQLVHRWTGYFHVPNRTRGGWGGEEGRLGYCHHKT